MRRPLLTLLPAAALTGLAAFALARPDLPRALAAPPAPPRKQVAAPTGVARIAGVDWTSDLAAAHVRARRERKPVLLLQLFGRLDQRFC